MLDLKFVSSVAERDLDFIVLEELEVSDEFRAWFAARVYEAPIFKQRIGAWHSVSVAGLGESDLVFIFEGTDGSRKAVLIENKIDAPAQREQGVRYRKRGERGVADDTWDEFRTCIIAPSRYLGSSKQSEAYDAEVSYEEIMANFVGRGFRDERFAYRARLVQEGIEQNRRGYQPKISEPMTTFVEDYVTHVRENFPNVGVERVKPRPAGSTWIEFHPKKLSKGVMILHQLTAGFVKVLLAGRSDELEHYENKYGEQPILTNFAVQRAGKSIGLAATVSVIDPIGETFEASRERVAEAMKTLIELIAVVDSAGDL